MLWDWLGDFKALEQEPVHSSEDRQSCPRIEFSAVILRVKNVPKDLTEKKGTKA